MAQIIHNVSFPNDNLGDPLRTAFVHQNEMNTELYETKVDKILGQGLSENNYTTTEQTKLAGIEAGAEVNVQSDWNQGDTAADDYIKNKPELSLIAGFPETRFDYAGLLSFNIPENVQATVVKKNGNPTEYQSTWEQSGDVITYLGTMEAGDYLLISGVYVVPSGGGGVGVGIQSVTDDGNNVVTVDNSDPDNPIIGFNGIITDGVTIGGSGTVADPLEVIGGGGTGAVDSVNGKTGVVVLGADNIAESTNRKWVSPSEKTTWNGKQSVSPTDGKTYGLKDGTLVQITNNVTIADATNSIEVTSSTNTLVKEYDLGVLTGKSILDFSFYFEKSTVASEIVQAEIWLYDTVTTTEYRIARNQASAANQVFPILRNVTFNIVTGFMKSTSPTVSAATDGQNSNSPMVEQTVSFLNAMKLRVYLRNVGGTTAGVRQFSGLAILR